MASLDITVASSVLVLLLRRHGKLHRRPVWRHRGPGLSSGMTFSSTPARWRWPNSSAAEGSSRISAKRLTPETADDNEIGDLHHVTTHRPRPPKRHQSRQA